jgi:hypothetical protein
MPPVATVQLPGGWLDDAGVCHRDAELRPLQGLDEEWLAELPLVTPLSRAVTGLLARCVVRLGPGRPGDATLGALPVGDRDYLVLELRRLSFGDRVEMSLTCSRPGCGVRMDIDFPLGAIAVHEAPQRPEYRLPRAGGAGAVRFRLPQGTDLEELASAGAEDLGTALLERCLLGDEPDLAGWSAGQRAELELAVEEVSPKIEAELEAACPDCGHPTVVPFDPVLEFFAEVARRRPELDRDVHLLSYHYHWPLTEILGMPRLRRRQYVALLQDQLDSTVAATG